MHENILRRVDNWQGVLGLICNKLSKETSTVMKLQKKVIRIYIIITNTKFWSNYNINLLKNGGVQKILLFVFWDRVSIHSPG
jgi:hypothetical protein